VSKKKKEIEGDGVFDIVDADTKLFLMRRRPS
jgi:hypothetical protein